MLVLWRSLFESERVHMGLRKVIEDDTLTRACFRQSFRLEPGSFASITLSEHVL